MSTTRRSRSIEYPTSDGKPVAEVERPHRDLEEIRRRLEGLPGD
jgi:hypothetical protein